jgi:hypothetical protein
MIVLEQVYVKVNAEWLEWVHFSLGAVLQVSGRGVPRPLNQSFPALVNLVAQAFS